MNIRTHGATVKKNCQLMLEFFILLAPLGKKIIAFMSEDFKYTAVLSLAIDRFVW